MQDLPSQVHHHQLNAPPKHRKLRQETEGNLYGRKQNIISSSNMNSTF